MILIVVFILLQISFSTHILFLILYILKRTNRYFKLFINTAISNILLAIIISGIVLAKPQYFKYVDFDLLVWLMSGFLMFIMLAIKINIFINIYKRSKKPENYHYNFFGKKVLHGNVVKQEEVKTFFLTIPFFFVFGAYFVAKLINYFISGKF